MLANIRRQLGPTRKRLNDRIAEAKDAVAAGDMDKMKIARTKLISNLEYHTKLVGGLSNIVSVSDEEEETINDEMTACTMTEMDVQEMCAVLNEKINDNAEDSDNSLAQYRSQLMVQEIEKLKVETEYKRMQIDKLKTPDEIKSRGQSTRLPELTLPLFTGNRTEWPFY